MRLLNRLSTRLREATWPTWTFSGVLLLALAICAALVGANSTSTHTYDQVLDGYDRAVSVSPLGATPTSDDVGTARGPGTAVRQHAVVTSDFGVAAEGAADDWPVISGIVRDAAKGKGNYGLGSGTVSRAERAGQSWVGDGYRVASDGKTLISRDGLRQFRPPSYKPNLDSWQANFEQRWVPEGQWQGNGHLDITDIP